MKMASSSPKKVPRVKPKKYTTCQLYNTKEASEVLKGLTFAACNPASEKVQSDDQLVKEGDAETTPLLGADLSSLTVSETMTCNYCEALFSNRLEQRRHYRSDWHRYNLKQRLKGREHVTEEQFEEVSGNISSLSGSDSDDDSETDEERKEKLNNRRLIGFPSRLVQSTSSTDSESESGNQPEDTARRLPKFYFKNHDGQLLSMYRCVICHKKQQPVRPEDMFALVLDTPKQMNWAVFMTGGGHFAAAIFSKEQLVAHKTFHRYVVRAKRGTAQSSRDSQGNAPKSAGASLRRYNEAALTQDIQELISSWTEHLKTCDKIFLRAPSFNRKIFFSGKNPPFKKDDERIRLIPFQTRRPTFNEVRRVYEMLASIECYGDEADIKEFVPITPPQVFNPETGQLTPRDESQLSPRQRKIINKKLNRASPLVTDENKASQDTDQDMADKAPADGEEDTGKTDRKSLAPVLPNHVVREDNMSSGASTCSDTELVETMEIINLSELKEMSSPKKPKQRKKKGRQRRGSLRCQIEPESNVMEEEKYHLKNNLYTACKVGDLASLKNLLAIFITEVVRVQGDKGVGKDGVHEQEGNKDVGEIVSNIGGEAELGLETSVEDCKPDKVSGERIGVNSDGPVKAKHLVVVKHSATYDVSVNKTFKNDVQKVTDVNNQDACENSYTSEDVGQSGCTHSDMRVDNGSIQPSEPFVSATQKSGEIGVGKEDTCNQSTKLLGGSDQNKDAELIEDMPLESSSTIATPSSLALKVSGGGLPDMSPVVTVAMLSEVFGDNCNTLLHVAAREGHKGIVTLLLDTGADPAVRDKAGQTPYMVSKDKPTRNEFRRFMAQWPDKYDYETAKIPGPLTEEMENERKKKEAEKKKLQKKAKQERLKAKREEDEKREAEEREKKRYLNLSDREKRALAAERRLVSQVTSDGGKTPVLSRCFQCGTDMTGKVPFEYCDNKFCTSKCLQLHRKSQAKS